MADLKAVVIGASAGGVQALLKILPALSANFPVPIMIVLHIPSDRGSLLASLFDSKCQLAVKEAEDKDTATAGTIYFAPPDYHLLVETTADLALSTDAPVNFSRPSIDVLFQSAADAFGDRLLAILLTGASHDGARGLAAVAAAGGTTVIEDPATAYARAMPDAGILFCPTAEVKPLGAIADQLKAIEAYEHSRTAD